MRRSSRSPTGEGSASWPARKEGGKVADSEAIPSYDTTASPRGFAVLPEIRSQALEHVRIRAPLDRERHRCTTRRVEHLDCELHRRGRGVPGVARGMLDRRLVHAD